MKKIWFIGLFLFVGVMLAGCQVSNTEVDRFSFELEVVNINGSVIFEQIIVSYDDEEQDELIKMLDRQVGLDYDVYDFGVLVNGVAGFYPTEYSVNYNYYYSLYIDDELSSVGISDITPTEGMKISFVETTVLDEIDYQVDALINSFITNQLSNYVNDEMANHYVLAALKQLNVYGYNVPALDDTLLDISGYSQQTDTISNTFKTTVFDKSFDINLDDVETALANFTADNSYDAISLLNALSMTDGASTQIDEIIALLTSGTPLYMDSDYAGMLLLALAPYADYEGVSSITSDMLLFIDGTITADGIESWGNANSSSTATVIMGLVAQGINPRGDDYTTEDTDLIEALLNYEIDGTFKWLIDDEEADLDFSTPQVFASLVAYKIFRDVYGNPAFNIFDF
ncbi:MAG: hypothetical protein JXC31_04365 [Acholeplasmataceae bacterium]|nr:hypothetical protein [Acholeplasmataceae bacterium]